MSFMDLKGLRVKLVRLVLLRAFILASALSVVPLLHSLSGSDIRFLASKGCVLGNSGRFSGSNVSWNHPFVRSIWGSFRSVQWEKTVNLTANVVRELMSMQMLSNDSRSLCVSEDSAAAVLALRELGIKNAYGVYRRPIFSLKRKRFVFELDCEENTYDFVFSRDLESASIPAIIVFEIERVLKPGGIGALVVDASDRNMNSLVRSATPVSSLLKRSDVVHVGFVNGSSVGYDNGLTLVVFKKKSEVNSYLQQFPLPAECPSLVNNKPFIEQMEPLVAEKPIGKEILYAYLPKFVDVSAKKRLVYVDIGAGDPMNTSLLNRWFPSYPVSRQVFNVYLVDHNTSVMLSYVKEPGVTFVYHPELAGSKETTNPADTQPDPDYDFHLDDEAFDFLAWFKETVRYADFLVMKMNAGKVELKFLSELFESGVICFVDELFLHCSDPMKGDGAIKGDCMNLFRGLRRSGVFVHQWWSDRLR